MKHLPPSPGIRSLMAEYKRSHFHVRVSNDLTLDDILRPAFWAHHATALKVDDLVDVVSDVLDVQFRVAETGAGFVRMRPLRIWAKEAPAAAVAVPEKPAAPMPDGYEAKKGPGGRFRVFQKNPLIDIGNGKTFLTEAEAVDAAIAHHKAANEAVAA